MMNYIKSQSSSIPFQNTLQEEMGRTSEGARRKMDNGGHEKEHHFYWKEQRTDKLWLFRVGYLADIPLKVK